MKFKLFFGMLFVFASFSTLSAQNYLPADQAVQVLSDTARNIEAGITQAPSIQSTAPGTGANSPVIGANSPANLAATANTWYIKLLNLFAEEISKTKDTASGYANAVAILDAANAQAELGNMQVDIQNLISN